MQLAPGQVGWDWLSVHLDDGSELMLYQMRLENGTADPTSSGTLVAADGSHDASPEHRISNDSDGLLEEQSHEGAISDRMAR